jgi:hypothetical protein
MGATLPIYSGGYDPEPHLQVLAEHIAGFEGTGLPRRVLQGLDAAALLMSPGVAQALHGWHVQVGRGQSQPSPCADASQALDDLPPRRRCGRIHLEGMIDAGTAPAAYAISRDPERLVPTISYPESLAIGARR